MVDNQEVIKKIDVYIEQKVNALLLNEWQKFKNGLMGLFKSEEVLLRFCRVYAQKHNVKSSFEEIFREKYIAEVLQMVMDKINSITGEGT